MTFFPAPGLDFANRFANVFANTGQDRLAREARILRGESDECVLIRT